MPNGMKGFELTADFTMMFWMTANKIDEFLTNFNTVNNAININFVRDSIWRSFTKGLF